MDQQGILRSVFTAREQLEKTIAAMLANTSKLSGSRPSLLGQLGCEEKVLSWF